MADSIYSRGIRTGAPYKQEDPELLIPEAEAPVISEYDTQNREVTIPPAQQEPSFAEAFSTARNAGASGFEWQGQKFNTRTAEEEAAQKRSIIPNPLKVDPSLPLPFQFSSRTPLGMMQGTVGNVLGLPGQGYPLPARVAMQGIKGLAGEAAAKQQTTPAAVQGTSTLEKMGLPTGSGQDAETPSAPADVTKLLADHKAVREQGNFAGAAITGRAYSTARKADLQRQYPGIKDTDVNAIVEEELRTGKQSERLKGPTLSKPREGAVFATTPKPADDRAVSERVTDLGKATMESAASLVGTAGDIAALMGADPNNFAARMGDEATAYWRKSMSEYQQQRDKYKGEQTALAEAERGQAAAFATAFKMGLEDIPQEMARNIYMLAASGFSGVVAKQALKQSFVWLSEKALINAGVATQIATGGALQGGDIGGDTYEEVYGKLIKQGVDQQSAHEAALSLGQAAAVKAGIVSVITNYGLPWGTSLEKAWVGGLQRGGLPRALHAVRAALGEMGQEATEEGWGQRIKNEQIFPKVDPSVDKNRGVGAAAGQGAAVGFGAGATAGVLTGGDEETVDKGPSLEDYRQLAQEKLHIGKQTAPAAARPEGGSETVDNGPGTDRMSYREPTIEPVAPVSVGETPDTLQAAATQRLEPAFTEEPGGTMPPEAGISARGVEPVVSNLEEAPRPGLRAEPFVTGEEVPPAETGTTTPQEPVVSNLEEAPRPGLRTEPFMGSEAVPQAESVTTAPQEPVVSNLEEAARPGPRTEPTLGTTESGQAAVSARVSEAEAKLQEAQIVLEDLRQTPGASPMAIQRAEDQVYAAELERDVALVMESTAPASVEPVPTQKPGESAPMVATETEQMTEAESALQETTRPQVEPVSQAVPTAEDETPPSASEETGDSITVLGMMGGRGDVNVDVTTIVQAGGKVVEEDLAEKEARARAERLTATTGIRHVAVKDSTAGTWSVVIPPTDTGQTQLTKEQPYEQQYPDFPDVSLGDAKAVAKFRDNARLAEGDAIPVSQKAVFAGELSAPEGFRVITPAEARALEAIAKLFGFKATYYTATGEHVGSGVFDFHQPDRVFVNTLVHRSDTVTPTNTVMHEIGHGIESRHPEVYAATLARLSPLMTKERRAKFFTSYFNSTPLGKLKPVEVQTMLAWKTLPAETDPLVKLWRDAGNVGSATPDQIVERELTSDLFANRALEPKFFSSVVSQLEAKHGLAKAAKMIRDAFEDLIKVLNDVIDRFLDNQPGTGKFHDADAIMLKDLTKVRDALQDMMTEVLAREAKREAATQAAKTGVAKSPVRMQEKEQHAALEAIPSESTRIGKAVAAMPFMGKKAYSNAVFKAVSPDEVVKGVLNRPDLDVRVEASEGGFQPEGSTPKISPNVVVTVSGQKPVTLQEAISAAYALGEVYMQDGVPVYRFDPTLAGGEATDSAGTINLVAVISLPSGTGVAAQRRVFDALHKEFGDYIGYTHVPGTDSILFGNYGITDDDSFGKRVKSVAKRLGVHADFDYTEGYYADINWQEDASGSHSFVRGDAAPERSPAVQERLDTWRKRAEETGSQWLHERGIAFNRARSHAAAGQRHGEGTQEERNETAQQQGYGKAREGAVRVTGVHYSQQWLPVLDSSFYGSGMQGAERGRLDLPSATKEQISRTYFYVDEGNGVTPEEDVGRVAHTINLNNLYDWNKDPDGLLKAASERPGFNTYGDVVNYAEQNVMAAGYDGYYVRGAQGKQGGAVLLGDHKVDTRRLALSPRRTKPKFYSQLQRMVEGAKQETMPAKQWKAWINANAQKSGVKLDEIQWTGVLDFLDMQGGEKVTRDALGDYLKANSIKVESIVHGEPIDGITIDREDTLFVRENLKPYEPQWELVKNGEVVATYDDEAEARDMEDALWDRATSHSRHTPPGSLGGAREILVTLPNKQGAKYERIKRKVYRNETLTPEENEFYGTYIPNEGSFKSSHWAEKNVLVHDRLDTIRLTDGSEALRLIEVQSDWGQRGRKEGFGNKSGFAVVFPDGLQFGQYEDRAEAYRGLSRANQGLAEAERATIQPAPVSTGIPSAPFVTETKSWVALGLKRLIQYAVEQGHDKVVIATGAQNADLYNLSKQVKSISYMKRKDGTYHVVAQRLDGQGDVELGSHNTEKDLEEKVGKVIAEKIVNGEGISSGGDMTTLQGLDLEVGSEKMRKFYDEIVPQVATDVLRKIGGGKLENFQGTPSREGGNYSITPRSIGGFTARVGNEAANWSRWEDANNWINQRLGITYKGFVITPEMRAKVFEGMPLFNRPRKATTVDLDAHEAATSPHNNLSEPSLAQKKAGNYQKGHTSIAGLDISIENPKGSERKGVDPSGRPWSITMKDHYGYFLNTTGKDKDHVDVFIQPGTATDFDGPVYVIDQQKGNGQLDEHKVMLGYSDLTSARNAYQSNYSKGWKGMKSITAMPMPAFKDWLSNGDMTKFAVVWSRPRRQDVALAETLTRSLPALPNAADQQEADARFERMYQAAINGIKEGGEYPEGHRLLPMTPMPAVLRMFGAPNQMVMMDISIADKIGIYKHKDDMGAMTLPELNRRLREPWMVIRNPDDSLVVALGNMGKDGPMVVALIPDVLLPESTVKHTAVKSVYGVPSEKLIQWMKKGEVLYFAEEKTPSTQGNAWLSARTTGRIQGTPDVDGLKDETSAGLSNRPGPSAPAPVSADLRRTLIPLREGVRERSIKDWPALVKYIGNTYRGQRELHPARNLRRIDPPINIKPDDFVYAVPAAEQVLSPTLVAESRRNVASHKEAKYVTAGLSEEDAKKAKQLLEPMLAAAEAAKPDFDKRLAFAAQRAEAMGILVAPVKGLSRAVEKLSDEYQMDTSQMRDLVRGTIVVASYADLPGVIQVVQEVFEIDSGRIKNRTPVSITGIDNRGSTEAGYSDVLINVKLPSGVLGEVQINTPVMLAAKELGHEMYAIERALPKTSPDFATLQFGERALYSEALALSISRSSALENSLLDMNKPEEGRPDTGLRSPVRRSTMETTPSGVSTKKESPSLDSTKRESSGNVGAGMVEPPAVNYNRPRTGAPVPPAETRMQTLHREVVDSFGRFKVLEKWAGTENASSTYKAEVAMHGRIGERIRDFREKRVMPWVKAAQKAGIAPETVAQYLHALHAEERNAQIATINAAYPDGGSGMDNKTAQDILSAAKALPNYRDLQGLAKRMHEIVGDTKDLLLKAGIINQDTVDAWEATYRYYVPLKGGDDAGAKQGTGKGLSVSGKQKRALGHGVRDEFIIENILRGYERAVHLSEKNRVMQILAKWLGEMANPNLGTIGEPEQRAVLQKGRTLYEVTYHGSTVGTFESERDANDFIHDESMAYDRKPQDFKLVKHRGDPQVVYMASPSLGPNEFSMYEDGQLVRIQLNDELLARAVGRMSAQELGRVLTAARDFNNYLSKAYTGRNPDFITANMLRDFQSGLLNTTGEYGIGIAARAALTYPGALAEMVRYQTAGTESAMLTQYRMDGGTTGAGWLSSLERLAKDVGNAYEDYQGAVKAFQKGSPGKASWIATRKLVNALTKWVEHLNAATENAMRYAVYQAVLKSTGDRTEAVYAAKSMTVNFDKKGEIGQQAGAMYLFFNPAINGAYTNWHALARGKHKGQLLLLAGGAIPLLGYLMAALGDDDPDMEGISRWERARNIIIPLGNDKRLTIPMPYGYSFFYNMGQFLYDYGKTKDTAQLAVDTALSFQDNFSPIKLFSEDEFQPWEMIPTEPARMVMRLSVNKKTFGSNIYPESKFDPYQPDSTKMFRRTVGSIYDDITSTANTLTGGSVTQPGTVDVSPETLRFWWESMTGGAGAFVENVVTFGKLAATEPSTIEVRDVPFARRFVKEKNIAELRNQYLRVLEAARHAEADVNRAYRTAEPDYAGAKIAAKRHKAAEEYLAVLESGKEWLQVITAQRTAIMRSDLSTGEKRLRLKSLENEEKQVYQTALESVPEELRAVR